MFRFPLLTKEKIFRVRDYSGKEKLVMRSKAEGKGCILAATHCGNWEMEGAALALYGYPLLSVAMKQNNEEFDRFLCEYRSMPGQTVEYKTEVRDMLRRLKRDTSWDFCATRTPETRGSCLISSGRKH